MSYDNMDHEASRKAAKSQRIIKKDRMVRSSIQYPSNHIARHPGRRYGFKGAMIDQMSYAHTGEQSAKRLYSLKFYDVWTDNDVAGL